MDGPISICADNSYTSHSIQRPAREFELVDLLKSSPLVEKFLLSACREVLFYVKEKKDNLLIKAMTLVSERLDIQSFLFLK